jgi:DNA-binding MarR family transcriptional regulator
MTQLAAEADRPTTCTCGKLRRLTRRVTQIYDQFLEPAGLTITQYGILGSIAANEGITIGALADIMVMDPTTLTRNLRPIEQQGLINLVRDTADRRRQGIWISERGSTALREAKPYWRKAQSHVAAIIGQDKVGRLGDVLDQSLRQLLTAA